MNWSKINPHKTKIIAASAVTAVAVGAGALFYGVKPLSSSNTVQPPPSNLTAQAAPTPTAVNLKIKGNKSSKIYHSRGCPNYNDIAERNIVWFKTKDEAEAAGYRMAKNC